MSTPDFVLTQPQILQWIASPLRNTIHPIDRPLPRPIPPGKKESEQLSNLQDVDVIAHGCFTRDAIPILRLTDWTFANCALFGAQRSTLTTGLGAKWQ
jgi:hypothetical protein